MKDLLLYIDSYPEPTPTALIDEAITFAALLNSRLSAIAAQVLIQPPHNPLASLLGVGAIAAEQQAKSARACKEALAYFESAAKAKGVLEHTIAIQSDLSLVGAHVAGHAKSRDACLAPLAGAFDGQREAAEVLVFASGRPTLLYGPSAPLPRQLRNIVLAWDKSRTAARAMADALPLLKQAERVHVLTVLGDKPGVGPGAGHDVVRHLAVHGVNAAAVDVDAEGKPIGAVLDGFLDQTQCDVFVMGAFGKSRIREFILGGATAHMLSHAKHALFLSH